MPQLLFNPSAGRVKLITLNDNSVPAMIVFPDLDYTSYQVILSGFMLQTNPKYQATETLGGNVLLISFGESLGPVQLRGALFEQTCENQSTGGVASLIRWWNANNVTRRATPIEVLIGDNYLIRAFMGAMQIQVSDPKDRIWQFNLGLMSIPERTQLDEGLFDAVASPQSISPQPAEDPQLVDPGISLTPFSNNLSSVGSFIRPTGYDDPLVGLSSPANL